MGVQPGRKRKRGQPDTESEGARQTQNRRLDPTQQAGRMPEKDTPA